MPRTARPPSNFVSDRHVLYTGWVLGELVRSGLPFVAVRDADGNYTNRITVTPPLNDNPPHILLMIPPPPDDWDLFDGAAPSGPVFRGEPKA